MHVEKVALLRSLQLQAVRLTGCFVAPGAELCTSTAPEGQEKHKFAMLTVHMQYPLGTSLLCYQDLSNTCVHTLYLACCDTVRIRKVDFH